MRQRGFPTLCVIGILFLAVLSVSCYFVWRLPQEINLPSPPNLSSQITLLSLPPSPPLNLPKPAVGKKVVVDIQHQRLELSQNEEIIFSAKICSGSPEFVNEQGIRGDVYERYYLLSGYDIDKVSSFRDEEGRGIPMPYAVRLKNAVGNKGLRDGLWIHQGVMFPYPASHGCFRLSQSDAKKFFWLVKKDLDEGVRIPVEVVNARRW